MAEDQETDKAPKDGETTARDGKSSPTTTEIDPNDGETAEKGRWSVFLESKLALLIAGFVLTTICGGLLNDYIQEKRWQKETRFKIFQSQLADGDEVQSELLAKVGKIRQLLNTARRLANEAKMTTGEPDPSLIEARKYYDEVLGPPYLEWAYSMHQRRNKIALIFGPEAAQALINRDDNVLHVDICSVLVLDSDAGVNENCMERRKAEWQALRDGGRAHRPASLHHAFRVSRYLIKRMIWCKDPREKFPAKKTKCEDISRLSYVMNWRYNLSGTAANDLADTIYAEMLKLNASVR